MNYAEAQPLHVKRTELVKQLEAKRKENQAKETAAREKLLADFDKLAALIRDNANSNVVGRFVTDFAAYTTEEGGERVVVEHHRSEQTRTDETLEKLTRVLKIATDVEVEVRPSDDLYRYL